MIKEAAIFYNGNIYTGKRHCDIIHNIVLETYTSPIKGIQGFVTEDGIFVTREQAARIAYEAGQIKQKKSELYSEDLTNNC